jgi:hypothetical protein
MSDTTSFLKVMDAAIKVALFNRFKTILGLTNVNDDVVQYPKEVAFRQVSEKRARAVVEFINVWRETSNFSWARQRTAVARREILLSYADPHTKTRIISAKAIPADLGYRFWWWTKDYDKYNQVVESYSWWRQQNPNLGINFAESYPLELDLHFGEVVDESTVDTMFDQGLYFVGSAPINVDAWLVEGLSDFTVQSIIKSIYDDTVSGSDVLMERETIVPPPQV